MVFINGKGVWSYARHRRTDRGGWGELARLLAGKPRGRWEVTFLSERMGGEGGMQGGAYFEQWGW